MRNNCSTMMDISAFLV